MDSTNAYNICRLCLCERESLINIFVLNETVGYIAADIIMDLLQIQVNVNDRYPDYVCLPCLNKLTDFKAFKDQCVQSKFIFDKAFHRRNLAFAETVCSNSVITEEQVMPIGDCLIPANEIKVEPIEEMTAPDTEVYKEEPASHAGDVLIHANEIKVEFVEGSKENDAEEEPSTHAEEDLISVDEIKVETVEGSGGVEAEVITDDYIGGDIRDGETKADDDEMKVEHVCLRCGAKFGDRPLLIKHRRETHRSEKSGETLSEQTGLVSRIGEIPVVFETTTADSEVGITLQSPLYLTRNRLKNLQSPDKAGNEPDSGTGKLPLKNVRGAPMTPAERLRKHRERKRLRELLLGKTRKTPMTSAERMKRYRANKKSRQMKGELSDSLENDDSILTSSGERLSEPTVNDFDVGRTSVVCETTEAGSGVGVNLLLIKEDSEDEVGSNNEADDRLLGGWETASDDVAEQSGQLYPIVEMRVDNEPSLVQSRLRTLLSMPRVARNGEGSSNEEGDGSDTGIGPLPKTASQRNKEYRDRKKVMLGEGEAKRRPKSASQRNKEYRERKKLRQAEENGANITRPPPKTAAQYNREYRERKKLRDAERNGGNLSRPPPKSASQRNKEYRQRIKLIRERGNGDDSHSRPPPKSSSERSKEFRERQKAFFKTTGVNLNSQRCKEYRDRKRKAKSVETSPVQWIRGDHGNRSPKSSSERGKEFSERRKSLVVSTGLDPTSRSIECSKIDVSKIELSKMDVSMIDISNSDVSQTDSILTVQEDDELRPPRKLPRPSNRRSWTKDELKAAVDAVREGRKLREVSRSFKIPVSTLSGKVKNGLSERAVKLGRKCIFSPDEEKQIANLLVILSWQFYGLTQAEFRRSVYRYAENNKVRHTFSNETKLAGKDWLYNFMERHPELSFRKPEASPSNRMSCIKRNEFDRFYDELFSLFRLRSYSPGRIFNAGEMVLTSARRLDRSLPPRGPGDACEDEGGVVTLFCCTNASGTYVPPMILLPLGGHRDPPTTSSGPPGSTVVFSPGGLMNACLFADWLASFCLNVRSNGEDPVLLILDDISRFASPQVEDICGENSVTLISTPPCAANRLQPLELALFAPLRKSYDRACLARWESDPRREIALETVPALVAEAMRKVADRQVSGKGFRRCGIYPAELEKFVEAEGGAGSADSSDADDFGSTTSSGEIGRGSGFHSPGGAAVGGDGGAAGAAGTSKFNSPVVEGSVESARSSAVLGVTKEIGTR